MRYLIPILFISLSSCKLCKVTENTKEATKQTETTFIKVSDTLLPGFDLKAIPVDVNLLPQYDTIKVTDPKTQAELTIWKNKYGELEANCKESDKIIPKTEVIKSKDKDTVKSKEVVKTRYKYDKWTFIPWGIIALYIAFQVLRRRFLGL